MFTSAYVTNDTDAFYSQRTCMLSYNAEVALSIPQIMAKRCLFSEDYRPPHGPVGSSITFDDKSNLNYSERTAHLAITDDYDTIFSHVNIYWVRNNLSLVDIAEHAKSLNPNLRIDSWVDYSALDINVRGQVTAKAIRDYAKKNRRNVRDLVRLEVLTWEQFNERYTYYENSKNEIVVVTNVQSENFLISQYYDVQNTLLYGEHRRPGEFLYWYSSKNFLSDYINQSSIKSASLVPRFFASDDYQGIEQAILTDNPGKLTISAGKPICSLKNIPHPLSSAFPIEVHALRNTFTGEQLNTYAKDLGIKGYSGKTKSELILIIGEHIAAQQPSSTLDKPLILRQDAEDSFRGQRPNHQVHSIEEYFQLAIRTIGKVAYSPNFTPSPAGRLNMTGKFDEIYGFKPLDIITPPQP